jgi:hypothetical protein
MARPSFEVVEPATVARPSRRMRPSRVRVMESHKEAPRTLLIVRNLAGTELLMTCMTSCNLALEKANILAAHLTGWPGILVSTDDGAELRDRRVYSGCRRGSSSSVEFPRIERPLVISMVRLVSSAVAPELEKEEITSVSPRS